MAAGAKLRDLVKDIVGGQQALGLDEIDASVAQQGGGVGDGLAGVGGGSRRRKAGDDGNVREFGGKLLQHLAGAGDKGRDFDQIAGRISADGELGKDDERRHRANGRRE